MLEQQRMEQQTNKVEMTKVSIIENRERHYKKLQHEAEQKQNRNLILEKAQEKTSIFKDKLYVEKNDSIKRLEDYRDKRNL